MVPMAKGVESVFPEMLPQAGKHGMPLVIQDDGGVPCQCNKTEHPLLLLNGGT